MVACKCGNEKCYGFQLLHPMELHEIPERTKLLNAKYGDVNFDLRISPSSGEIFTAFYELHVATK